MGRQGFRLRNCFGGPPGSKGDAGAVWIAAATLDRYLQSVGKPQIYGTQFLTPAGKPPTQDPYDRALIGDALRHDLGVPKIANQRTSWTG